MQIFGAQQIREWDEFTMVHEPVASIDLMERAAKACFQWLTDHGYRDKNFTIFCGKGNNGGDGLAIARMLASAGNGVTVCILEFGHKGTEDFQSNLARLHETPVVIKFVSVEETLPRIEKGQVIIDALLGSGLNRELEGLTAKLVAHMNDSGNEIIAIDIPSGLFLERSSLKNIVVRATHTLTFQSRKLAFLMEETQQFIGEVHVLDIGLHKQFADEVEATFNLIDPAMIRSMFSKRKRFSHKGDYGHAAIIAGSRGMMGAAVLAAKAALHSGVGKLTCHIPACGYEIMQISVPEAMSKTEDGTDHLVSISDTEKYDAIGIGPGLGLHGSHRHLLQTVFERFRKPIIVDADALNTIATDKTLLELLPENSILTPHAREFERIFGEPADEFTRIEMAVENARHYKIIILIKGPFTCIALPSGKVYFNDTGNPGMASGGTGDTLTGIITSLAAQHISPQNAAIGGAYLHGLAGDMAAAAHSQQSMTATDLINHLGDAFIQLQG